MVEEYGILEDEVEGMREFNESMLVQEFQGGGNAGSIGHVGGDRFSMLGVDTH